VLSDQKIQPCDRIHQRVDKKPPQNTFLKKRIALTTCLHGNYALKFFILGPVKYLFIDKLVTYLSINLLTAKNNN
jgi:hypothetical protein